MGQIESTVCINNLGLNLLWNCLNLALSLAGAKDNKEKPISTKSIKADKKYLRMQKKKLEKKGYEHFLTKINDVKAQYCLNSCNCERQRKMLIMLKTMMKLKA